jgi:ribosomal-protein-alanine N-acetyltransferase
MGHEDLDLVWATEAQAHGHPWSRGHFRDTIAAGHPAWLLTSAPLTGQEHAGPKTASGRVLLGYGVALASPDEWHVLNLVVSPDHRRQGWGRLMLQALGRRAQAAGAEGLLLEVRESNRAAHALYASLGFEAVGQRKNYYPAGSAGREHALVLRWRWAPLETGA